MAAPKQDQMDLTEFVPALLNFVANRLTSSGSAIYRGQFGIGHMEFRVMAMLSIEPGASGAQIARVVGLDEAAVSRAAAALERRGLIAIARGPGRTRALTLTDPGRQLYERAWQAAKERERRLLCDFTEAEREVLRDFLRRLIAATDHVAALQVQTAGEPRDDPAADDDLSRRPVGGRGGAR